MFCAVRLCFMQNRASQSDSSNQVCSYLNMWSVVQLPGQCCRSCFELFGCATCVVSRITVRQFKSGVFMSAHTTQIPFLITWVVLSFMFWVVCLCFMQNRVSQSNSLNQDCSCLRSCGQLCFKLVFAITWAMLPLVFWIVWLCYMRSLASQSDNLNQVHACLSPMWPRYPYYLGNTVVHVLNCPTVLHA